MAFELITTADGSHTIYFPEFDAHYHSLHGAIQESIHVFIEAGLHFLSSKKKEISILETGFGTGLNALLSAIEAQKSGVEVNYTGLEAYPLPSEIVGKLNYPEILGEKELFASLHQVPWGICRRLTDHFSLTKINMTFDSFPADQKFDLLYFDAFAPGSQPELWSAEFLERMRMHLSTGGVLVTYCAKGVVKRVLRNLGFEVESLPGPPGKRQITRAIRK